MPPSGLLIVEDEGLIAADLRQKLEKLGYSVLAIADNAVDALLSVQRDKPSLVLMDIRLRGAQDGIETAAIIRDKHRTPVIFVSAHADRETLDRARLTEPFGFITKPFTSTNFQPHIEMAIYKHKMEHKVRASEAWLAATVCNVADALIATDPEGNIAFLNGLAADLTGWGPEEARARPFADVFQVFDPIGGRAVRALDNYGSGIDGGAETLPFTLKRRGCLAPLSIEAEFSSNRADDASLLGFIVVFRDVSVREEAARRDRQLEKMQALTVMAGGLASEMVGWQRRMDASLNQLIFDCRAYEIASQLPEDIYVAFGYQRSILNELIALGKNDCPLQIEVDLNAVLSSSRGRFEKTLGRRRSLLLETEAGLPAVRIDAENLEQNLIRLLIAVKDATGDKAVVTMATRTEVHRDGSPRVVLSVAHNGKPLQARARGRVFDPFFPPSMRDSGNSGLSLALVYRYVALNGGFIDAESSGETGACYRIAFPACAAPAAYARCASESGCL